MQGHLSSSFWEGSRALSVHPNGAALEQRWRHQKGVLAWKFVWTADVAGCFVPCLGKKGDFQPDLQTGGAGDLSAPGHQLDGLKAKLLDCSFWPSLKSHTPLTAEVMSSSVLWEKGQTRVNDAVHDSHCSPPGHSARL